MRRIVGLLEYLGIANLKQVFLSYLKAMTYQPLKYLVSGDVKITKILQLNHFIRICERVLKND